MSNLGENIVKGIVNPAEIEAMLNRYYAKVFRTFNADGSESDYNIIHPSSTMLLRHLFYVYDLAFKKEYFAGNVKETEVWLKKKGLSYKPSTWIVLFDSLLSKDYDSIIKSLRAKKTCLEMGGVIVGYVDKYSDGTPANCYVATFDSRYGLLSTELGEGDKEVYRNDKVAYVSLEDVLYMYAKRGGVKKYENVHRSERQMEYMLSDPEFHEANTRAGQEEDEEEEYDYRKYLYAGDDYEESEFSEYDF